MFPFRKVQLILYVDRISQYISSVSIPQGTINTAMRPPSIAPTYLFPFRKVQLILFCVCQITGFEIKFPFRKVQLIL